MRWLITEKCEYLVEAETQEKAEDLFLAHGPGDVQPPVTSIGVVDRMVEQADEAGVRWSAPL